MIGLASPAATQSRRGGSPQVIAIVALVVVIVSYLGAILALGLLRMRS